MSAAPPSSATTRNRILLGVVSLLAVVALVVAGLWTPEPAPQPVEVTEPPQFQEAIEKARFQLQQQQFAAALQTLETALESNPPPVAALMTAAEAHTRLEHWMPALDLYRRVPTDAEESLVATFSSAEIERLHGSIDRAIAGYRDVLSRSPEQSLADERLTDLLAMTGQWTESQPRLQSLVHRRVCRVEHLQWLVDPSRPIKVEAALRASLQAVPDQIAPRMGLAGIALQKGHVSEAHELIQAARQITQQNRDLEALWGRTLLELGRETEWSEWFARLPSQLAAHPDIWLQRSILAEKAGQRPAACRCALEALALAPFDREAAHRAGRHLVELGQADAAAPLLERGTQLGELSAVADSISLDAPPAEACLRESRILESLGRLDEAIAWAALAMRANPQDRSRLDLLLAKASQAASTPPVIAAVATRDQFPLPESPVSTAPASDGDDGQIAVSYVDEAAEVGIDFTYFEAPDPTTEGRRMFEFTGGGVAVLDFDRDSWPDLYFTQGSEIRDRHATGSHLDQLYRNRQGVRFTNVTAESRIVEPGYSQGVTAGDFNNDGFPDLYVANLGPNRLFENLGDGTFLEVPLPAADAWTTSCAMVDINGDSFPDLFDVNYLEGPGIWDQICSTPAGARVCTPFAFTPAPDRLCLGRGDGSFQDVSAASNIISPAGKGLGILIAPLVSENALDIFVANDTEANSLWVNSRPRGEKPRFSESAMLAGLAFGDDGKPQACMGIAAADFDGDGQIDLHITNYANESNNLSLFRNGTFEEVSRAWGIRGPSLPMLGFGTQAIDVDVDGDLDLVVANGDLDDFSHEGRAFRMRPQLFVNVGGRFRERISLDAGDYFANSSLHRGRGLARLDWNRDGREDFVVSHLDERVALVTNRTETVERLTELKIVGTTGSRDGIGARVTWGDSGTENSTRIVLGGDGYQSRNEAVMRLRLPSQPGTAHFRLQWPGGAMEQHDAPDVPCREVDIVEAQRLVIIP